MKIKRNDRKKAGAKPKILTATIVIVVVAMLTVGMVITQYQNAQVQKEQTKEVSISEASFEGAEDYCSIAQQAITCYGDAIARGDYTFDELQAYIDANGIPSSVTVQPVENRQQVLSFGGIAGIPQQPAQPAEQKISLIHINVVEVLKERFPQAVAYCQGGVPTDWEFHTPAICLALSLAPPLGVCMATGVVTSFFALFGVLSAGVGLIFWTLLLRGFGIIDPQLLELSMQIYENCMDLIG